MQKITPFLWFDKQAEEAANLYVSVFKNAKLGAITRYDEAGAKATGQEPGTAMTVEFELDGTSFVGLNGGPAHKFTEAVSFQIGCEDQEEVDHFWEKLSEGGEEGPCGWLKDKFGLSWQVVPNALPQLLKQSDPKKAQQVMQAMLKMKKIVIKDLEKASEG